MAGRSAVAPMGTVATLQVDRRTRKRERTRREIYDAAIDSVHHSRSRRINAVWGKLLVVGTEICGWKTYLLPEAISAGHCSQDSVLTTKHCRRSRKIASLNRLSDGGAANDFIVCLDWR